MKSTDEFSFELAFALYQSDEEFPVDLDDAWVWIGYTEKRNAKDTLFSAFEEGIDFSRSRTKSPSGGRPSDCFMLAVDCFKQMGMMARTTKGRQIRLHFLECEKIAIASLKQKDDNTPRITEDQILAHRFDSDLFQPFAQANPKASQIFLEWQGCVQRQIQSVLSTEDCKNANRLGLARNKVLKIIEMGMLPQDLTLEQIDAIALKYIRTGIIETDFVVPAPEIEYPDGFDLQPMKSAEPIPLTLDQKKAGKKSLNPPKSNLSWIPSSPNDLTPEMLEGYLAKDIFPHMAGTPAGEVPASEII